MRRLIDKVMQLLQTEGGLSAVIGAIVATIGAWFGGLPAVVQLLGALMVGDYITGLLVAGIWHASPKSADGTLESRAGWKGLCKKAVVIYMVYLAVFFDRYLGTGEFFRDAFAAGFAVIEAISLTENLGLMGVKFPEPVTKAVELLHTSVKTDPDDQNIK